MSVTGQIGLLVAVSAHLLNSQSRYTKKLTNTMWLIEFHNLEHQLYQSVYTLCWSVKSCFTNQPTSSEISVIVF